MLDTTENRRLKVLMKPAMYLRVSTHEQRKKQTIETQRAFAERFASSNGLCGCGWYLDNGVSGTIPLAERPEGARLLDDARAGKIDTVFVYKLDRLGREARLILNCVNELESLGVTVRSMTEPIDTGSPSGKFLLTVLSGAAGLERDTIIQRSVEGSNRLAREGTWLGGIVPYGYRVEGKDRDSRLAVSDQPIPGFKLSEADVVRLIYCMTVEERRSCAYIADYLNALGVPPVYTRDGRPLLRGKRRGATHGIWRAGRIRGVLVNPTYKGLHQYGKRSKIRRREVIDREVPAIVRVEQWERAQEVLREHMLFSRRNAKRSYLLRGLIKCGICGLTYIGTAGRLHDGSIRLYYVCNGRHQARRLYGTKEKKCPSASVNGDELEAAIWQDIEQFLRNPGQVLSLLEEQMRQRASETGQLHEEIARLQQSWQNKNNEKDAVIALFRKGRIDESDLDRQLDQIKQEGSAIQQQIEQLQGLAQDARSVEARLRSAEELLQALRQRLEEPLTRELRRQVVEALVERIWVRTNENERGEKGTRITVIYRFGVSLEL
jgi:site-specific DNA recombinase